MDKEAHGMETSNEIQKEKTSVAINRAGIPISS
jgi:hypothetical protein